MAAQPHAGLAKVDPVWTTKPEESRTVSEETTTPAGSESAEDADVAAVLATVRAGVRQRRAELATISEEIEKLPPALALVHELQYVDEPVCESHRPVVGRFIVLAKKFFYQAFMKWYLDSLVRQQNAFNRATSEALRDLLRRQRALAAELDRLGSAIGESTKR